MAAEAAIVGDAVAAAFGIVSAAATASALTAATGGSGWEQSF